MKTHTEQLQHVRSTIDLALDAIDADEEASPVLVAVVREFAKKCGKAAGLANRRDAVIELEQAGDSAKVAAEADPGIRPATRAAILDAHLAICVMKSKLPPR